MSKIKVIFILIMMLCTGCSLYLADMQDISNKIDVHDIVSRTHFLNLGAKVLHSEKDENGNLVEVYQIPKEKCAAVRALVNGMLDPSTGLILDLFGVPLELLLTRRDVITIKVQYNENEVPLNVVFL